jgi:beta-glucosidase
MAEAFTTVPAAGVPPAPVGQSTFFWGVSLSGYQNDGASPAMDWHAMEQSGKVPNRSGLGPDFRGHMDQDLDLAQSLGLNAFRTSLEWARLEPEPGRFDPEEVAYVHRLLQGIRKRGMEPIITLHHFATPSWVFHNKGNGSVGWESPETVQAYWRYVEFVVKEFGSQIDYYITFNEPSTLALGAYFMGWTTPFRTGPVAGINAFSQIWDAHAGAYARIHQRDPSARVSIAEYNCRFPLMGDLYFHFMPGHAAGYLMQQARGWDGRNRSANLDYIVIHYYGIVSAEAATKFPAEPYRWLVSPADLGKIVKAYHEMYHLPILIGENGLATRDGATRADGWTRESYLVAHVKEIERLRGEGIPIFGYLHWTLTDNYEWGSYSPRFGLWQVDISKGNLRRQETPAVNVYREIIRQRGVTDDLLRRYPPPRRKGGA